MRNLLVLVFLVVGPQLYCSKSHGQQDLEHSLVYNCFTEVTLVPVESDPSGAVTEVQLSVAARVLLETYKELELQTGPFLESAEIRAGWDNPMALMAKTISGASQASTSTEFYNSVFSGSGTYSLIDTIHGNTTSYWNHIPIQLSLIPKDSTEPHSTPDIGVLFVPDSVSASIRAHEIQWAGEYTDGSFGNEVDHDGPIQDVAWASAYYENNSDSAKSVTIYYYDYVHHQWTEFSSALPAPAGTSGYRVASLVVTQEIYDHGMPDDGMGHRKRSNLCLHAEIWGTTPPDPSTFKIPGDDFDIIGF